MESRGCGALLLTALHYIVHTASAFGQKTPNAEVIFLLTILRMADFRGWKQAKKTKKKISDAEADAEVPKVQKRVF